MNEWDRCIENTVSMLELEHGYDGMDTEPPAPILVCGAIKTLLAFKIQGCPAPTRVTASVNGTIFLEWHLATGYIEAEIEPIEEGNGWYIRLPKGTADIFRARGVQLN